MKRGVMLFLVLAAALIGFRLALPSIVQRYVQRTIDDTPGYSGSVGDIDIHLWRGAYTIHDLRLDKDGADIPVPFVRIPTMDLAIEWRALFHGSVVAVVSFKQPVVSFVKGQSGVSQTGAEANWARTLDELVPIEINLLTVEDGILAYQDLTATPPIDLSIDKMSLEARNLRNVEDHEDPLPSSFRIEGQSIGGGVLQADGKINILRQLPDLDLDLALEKISMPALNDYFRHHAAVDLTEGTLDVYCELAILDGKVRGYVKPLATDLDFIDLSNQDRNPLDAAWEAIVSAFATLFKNQPTDQLATRIELQGDLSDPDVSPWQALMGIFRNAFVQAFSRNIDGTINFLTPATTEEQGSP